MSVISRRIESGSQKPRSTNGNKGIDSRGERRTRKSQWDELSPSKKKRDSVLHTFDLNREFSSQITLKSSHAIINESNDTVRMHAKTRKSNQPGTAKMKNRFTPKPPKSEFENGRLKLGNKRFSLKKTNSDSNDQMLQPRLDEYGFEFPPNLNNVGGFAWVKMKNRGSAMSPELERKSSLHLGSKLSEQAEFESQNFENFESDQNLSELE